MFSVALSMTHTGASASDLTTLPVISSNMIFPEVDYFNNLAISSSLSDNYIISRPWQWL